MKLLIFDTETTGLPEGRNPSIFDHTKWPYIVQLSYIVYDTSANEIVEQVDDIIKVSVPISAESTKIHGISEEISQSRGVEVSSALTKFNHHLKHVDLVIGHNISFDKRVVMVECMRNKIMQQFSRAGIRKLEYCTMKQTTELCGIKVKNAQTNEEYFKYPTLSQLHRHLFDVTPTNNHNALIDVLLCLRCYMKVTYDCDIVVACNKVKALYEKIEFVS